MVELRDRRLLLFVLAGLVFARGVGGRMPYFLFYLAVAITLISYYWTRYGLPNLACTYAVDRRRLVAGEPLEIRLRLYNEWYLPLPWLEISDESPLGGVPVSSLVSIPGVGSRILRYSVPGIRRGSYRLGPLRLRSGDLLGLFQTSRDVYSDVHVLVLPRLHVARSLSIPARQPYGQHRTRERAFEDPSNLAEVRPFRVGDHQKMVHWKTTAKKGELHVKEYELTAASEMIVLLDLEQRAYDRPHPLLSEDTAVEAAASVVHYGIRAHHDVTFIGYAGTRLHLRLSRGGRRFPEFMELLARASASGGVPLPEVLAREVRHMSPRSTIVAISPGMTDELAANLFRLRMSGCGAVAVVVAAPEERNLWAARFRAARVPLYWLEPGRNLGQVTGGVAVAR